MKKKHTCGDWVHSPFLKNYFIYPSIIIVVNGLSNMAEEEKSSSKELYAICHSVICASKRVHIAFRNCKGCYWIAMVSYFVGAGDRITHSAAYSLKNNRLILGKPLFVLLLGALIGTQTVSWSHLRLPQHMWHDPRLSER